jgi:monofunctional biosynthetic peptidoglycan transglycosylase
VERGVIRGAWLCAKGIALLVLVTVIWAGALRFVNPPVTSLMILRHFGDGQPIEKVWRDYDEISPHLLLAILAAEDQRFYEHRGFDVKEIRNAIEARSNGGGMRGASTLSQQTAKNVFLWPTRSWWRKGVEAYFTVLIEALWPKRRILEVYVNVAEMGPGVYGVERAAQKYFNTSASELSPQQAALLASILPSPLTRDPRSPTAYMKQRQAWILNQMNNLGGVRFLK